jgi:hypothetical protein
MSSAMPSGTAWETMMRASGKPGEPARAVRHREDPLDGDRIAATQCLLDLDVGVVYGPGRDADPPRYTVPVPKDNLEGAVIVFSVLGEQRRHPLGGTFVPGLGPLPHHTRRRTPALGVGRMRRGLLPRRENGLGRAGEHGSRRYGE